MSSAGPEARLYPLLVAALLALFLGLSYSESRYKSATSDEAPHIAAGLSYLDTGVFRANLQHPPLLKEISALSMRMGGIHWPQSRLADAMLRGQYHSTLQLDWAVGNEILRSGPDRILSWARFPFPLIAALLGFLIFWWGRELVGAPAALAAVFLFVLDPTILAHSFLVTMDTGFAACTILFLFLLWRYIERPGLVRLLVCGLSLGAVLCTKFSALVLVPVAAALLLGSIDWKQAVMVERPPAPRKGRKRKPDDAPKPASRSGVVVNRLGAWTAILVIAFLVVEAIYFFPSDPLLYLTGMQRVNADHDPNYQAFMAGMLQPRFTSYFAVAYLLKEPLPSIALALAGLILLLRNRAMPLATKLFLLLPPLAIFLAHVLRADNLGIRYIIPVLIFAHLLGGYALAAMWRAGTRGRAAAAVLGVWLLIAAAGIYPDHLAYFNESACLLTTPGKIGWDGGSRCGTRWLDDSNIDWGQGLKQLKTWLDRNAPGRAVQLTQPFGFAFPSYGIPTVPAQDLRENPAPGLYAVSAHAVARIPALPGSSDWLRRTPPTAIVGHSIYIYDIK